ncbi:MULTISPECIES: histidine phosphatase family protein [unclassified Limnohabitans]|jgi:phosphohistidine phosphatase|uniref:SixA phosphatase family protein n=1 Tax=unclassified Limnohabitans TaxID=2626134 RepID=UPI0003171D11|nr:MULTISPECIES: histidine phosphatase family protein [unclassified Limnohabitans]PVE08974.1 histidine phosphatase family protein [Limnohabitans sp. Rim28]
MDLIIWRHAEAHEAESGEEDMLRALTPRGRKQADRMSVWLDAHLPQGTRVLSSPAVRAEQTVQALKRKYKVRDALSPGATVQDILETSGWPDAKYPVLLVGHQPALGGVVAQLLGMPEEACAIRKGSVWWLRHRQRDGQGQTVLMSVTGPEML